MNKRIVAMSLSTWIIQAMVIATFFIFSLIHIYSPSTITQTIQASSPHTLISMSIPPQLIFGVPGKHVFFEENLFTNNNTHEK
jgi:hypothetical protein